MNRRWLYQALRVSLWLMCALASLWLCLAVWQVDSPPDAPPTPASLARPMTDSDAIFMEQLELALQADLDQWRVVQGRYPETDELYAAIPNGLLPDNRALPDVGGLVESCAAALEASVDWQYCPATGQIRAGVPAAQ